MITCPPYINPKCFDPHYEYGSNELGARDPLAIALPDRATYEEACATFGVAPKSEEQLWHAAPLYEGPDFPLPEWAALGRNGRVSFRLDSIYYFALKAQRADEEWDREHPVLRQRAPTRQALGHNNRGGASDVVGVDAGQDCRTIW